MQAVLQSFIPTRVLLCLQAVQSLPSRLPGRRSNIQYDGEKSRSGTSLAIEKRLQMLGVFEKYVLQFLPCFELLHPIQVHHHSLLGETSAIWKPIHQRPIRNDFFSTAFD